MALHRCIGEQPIKAVVLPRQRLFVELPMEEPVTQPAEPKPLSQALLSGEALPHPGLLMHPSGDQVVEAQMIRDAAEGTTALLRRIDHVYKVQRQTSATTAATMKLSARPSRAISRMLTRFVA